MEKNLEIVLTNRWLYKHFQQILSLSGKLKRRWIDKKKKTKEVEKRIECMRGK